MLDTVLLWIVHQEGTPLGRGYSATSRVTSSRLRAASVKVVSPVATQREAAVETPAFHEVEHRQPRFDSWKVATSLLPLERGDHLRR
jgi:hypothetical protein